MASRKPDYRLGYLNKSTEERGHVGAAWKNEDESITIVLNPCVVLPASKNIVLTLFPADDKRFKERANRRAEDDDPPF